MIRKLSIGFVFSIMILVVHAQTWTVEKKVAGAFPVATATGTATIYVDSREPEVLQKAAALLQSDIEKVSSRKPLVVHTTAAAKGPWIIIGTMEHSSLIQQLAASKKINVAALKGKWEGYQVQVVQQPLPGVPQAMVITGSDRRGAAYGAMELSKQMGVSPWWWWADVPVPQRKEIWLKPALKISDAPAVQYRGIFLNDEAPALSGWAHEKFGGFNHRFYEKVFELMLRLKANYLWPAMWGNAFYDDDSLNRKAADDYAIVIGTSHHEPLMRAHDEWRRYGKGKWNYDSNATVLQQFWKDGLQRATNEKIVSIGMRGDGDEPMTRETATALLERIVADQRKIIASVTGKPAEQTPQLWALYKEVQDYYDKGMRVPDDVTLLLCDDNWGNLRRLPKLSDPPRKGGYGIYYHFDYVGGPRNYKWINTNNLARVWEQMHLAWAYKARKIWIVNVGDLKPMELPISFFLDYAWNPSAWTEDNIDQYYNRWSAQQFGKAHAEAVAKMLQQYARFSARRKPELLTAETYSMKNYNEAGQVLRDYQDLSAEAENLHQHLPVEYQDAFYQLVLHPIKASANLHELYVNVALNQEFAKWKWQGVNEYANRAKELYTQDSLITVAYHQLGGGKWNHMMDQTHIGYTHWQQPERNALPLLQYLPEDSLDVELPAEEMVAYSAAEMIPANSKGNIFFEENGLVSIEAAHWTTSVAHNNTHWKNIPGIGRTAGGITTFPVTAPESRSAADAYVTYDFYAYDSGKVTVHAYFSPTLNLFNNEGLRYAVSIDGAPEQVVSINREDNQVAVWESWVANNIIITTSLHTVQRRGKHTLKIRRVSPAVVLQKLVVDFGGMEKSYLGPPETVWKK